MGAQKHSSDLERDRAVKGGKEGKEEGELDDRRKERCTSKKHGAPEDNKDKHKFTPKGNLVRDVN